ncbi:MAG: hypothetical protein IPQ08_09450 [Chitinophagaceae bacterium]|nr:hypothetical protein [Chitinophagaceae bacterium]
MRNTVKSLALVTALFFSIQGFAQLKIGLADPFIADLKKIISSFPDHFHDYRGGVIVSSPQLTNYTCNLKISGAEEATITTYSGKKEIASWQAILLTTENFDKAKQKFRSLYNQINNISIASSVKIHAKYDAPVEENKFTSILFYPSAETGIWSLVRTELLLEFNAPMEWKIRVMVYDMERSDKEETGVRDGGIQ